MFASRSLIINRFRWIVCATLLTPSVLVACSSNGAGGGDTRSDSGTPDSGEAGMDGSCPDLQCPTGTICDAWQGECVASCIDFDCDSGQRCQVIEAHAQCIADCEGLTCGEDEQCDDSGDAARCVARCEQACGEGQRCTGSGDDAACSDVRCAELSCSLPSVCSPAEDGKGGNLCKDLSCDSDLDCQTEQFCYHDDETGPYCKGATCTAGTQRCASDGHTVLECLSNGSDWFERVTCTTDNCAEAGDSAFCPCTDDWSCPAFTVCERGVCEGTGVEPTCFVPVVAMEEVLPAQEFQWGTNAGVNADRALDSSSDVLGETHPFPQAIQVVNVPMVVNLTDDNGDGQVDEFDYPEIVFLSYCGGNYTNGGVLRAIHGGGFDALGQPIAGKDFFATTGADCNPASGGCDPTAPENWLVWNEGEDGASDSLDDAYSAGGPGCQNNNDPFDATSTVALGNLDGDAAGYPEIVVIGERNNDYVYIFDATGHFVARSNEVVSSNDSGAPAIANLDGQGLPEIVVGRYAWTLKLEAGKLAFDKVFVGDGSELGHNGSATIGPVGCVADLNTDGRQEVIVGGAAYSFPDVSSCNVTPCTMTALWRANVPGGEGYCAVADVWGADPLVAPHPVDNPLDGLPELITVRNGAVYVIDGATGAVIDSVAIAGAGGGPPNIDDFDGDSLPEVGTAGSTGYTVVDFQAADPLTGQAPACPAWTNVLDVSNPLAGNFEDDRGPYPSADPAEVGNEPRVVPTHADGSAIKCNSDAECNPGIDPYVFACNESTGACVCLHNGWTRKTQDGSSQATGSSVFDFNGDGAAEVIYNDECFFRIFSGLDGQLYSRIPSESRTRTEYPVVADLDNDGNAEIVFGVSNESKFCNGQWDATRSSFGGDYFVSAADPPAPWLDNPYTGQYNAGLEVWGEPRDLWVSARRIWNQHSYHITNVTEAGAIPSSQSASWSPLLRSERGFNSYRSNPPSRAGVAPDLQVVDVKVGASGGGCEALSSEIDIVARIRNAGDLRVGADVKVAFFGSWNGTRTALTHQSGQPIKPALGSPLRPGGELLVRVSYDSAGKSPDGLPDSVIAIVDPDDLERECDTGADTDNEASAPVKTPKSAPDLHITLDEVTGTCPDKTVSFTVHNDGGEAASDIRVRLYAGNPAGGGTTLATTTLTGPIAPGASATATAALTLERNVTLYAVVDPDNAIEECSEGNNGSMYRAEIVCTPVLLDVQ